MPRVIYDYIYLHMIRITINYDYKVDIRFCHIYYTVLNNYVLINYSSIMYGLVQNVVNIYLVNHMMLGNLLHVKKHIKQIK